MSDQGVPIIDQHIKLCFDQDLTQTEIAACPLIGENIQMSTRLAWLQLYRQEHFRDSAEIPERNSI